MKNVFAFPGVGVKPCGKEREFFLKNRKFILPFIETASMTLGRDLQGIFNQDEFVFKDAEDERFFTAAFSCGIASYFSGLGIEPDGAACYSFGIYPALYSAGVLSFADILKVMTVVENKMLDATKDCEEPSGMGVVVGLLKEDAEELIKRVDRKSLLKVNENNDTCIVVAGYKSDLRVYLEAALEEDAVSAELLEVNVPYHHSDILGNIKADLKKELQKFDWNDAGFPIISSVDRSVITDSVQILNLVVDNACSPISWFHVVEKAAQSGAEKIFECGHGISLTQNGRFSGFDVNYINIKNYKRKLKDSI